MFDMNDLLSACQMQTLLQPGLRSEPAAAARTPPPNSAPPARQESERHGSAGQTRSSQGPGTCRPEYRTPARHESPSPRAHCPITAHASVESVSAIRCREPDSSQDRRARLAYAPLLTRTT